MRIISRGLIPSSRPRPDYSSSITHLFRTILSVTSAPPSEVALIHQLVSGGTDWPPVHWLIKLWSELLLWSSPGSHLHPIHIDNDFTVVLAVVLSTSHTVVAGGCGDHRLHELLLVALRRSLRVSLSLLLRLTIRCDHAHGVVTAQETESACLDLSTGVEE